MKLISALLAQIGAIRKRGARTPEPCPPLADDPLTVTVDGLKAYASAPGMTLEALADWLLKSDALQANRLELEKRLAYVEIFTGANAAGYQRILDGNLASNDYRLLMTACTACYQVNRFREAYQLLSQFDISSLDDADCIEYLVFSGYMCHAAGYPIEEALAYFDKALQKCVFDLSLFINAYGVYFEAGRHDVVKDLGIAFHQNHILDPEATYSLACVELARDYYAEGFRLLECRYHMPEAHRSINPYLLNQVRWQGEDLMGKKLLVHGEQGLGDTVMMVRYLPLLCERGIKVAMDCRAEAFSLLQHNFPGCEFIVADQKSAIPCSFDVWTGIMSLPFHFNTTVATVPRKSGYLSVSVDASAYWMRRVHETSRGGSVSKVGVAWAGNPAHKADKRRSIPFEKLAACLKHFPEIDFFSLQLQEAPERLENLHSFSDELLTLADTAALIDQMDIVLSVDTSVVHLAGSIGKDAYLMLPKRYEWRWGLEGEGNAWYGSVKVLRQNVHGIWDDVLNQVLSRLSTLKSGGENATVD